VLLRARIYVEFGNLECFNSPTGFRSAAERGTLISPSTPPTELDREALRARGS